MEKTLGSKWLIEAAKKYPDKIALITDDSQLSFQALNDNANLYSGYYQKHVPDVIQRVAVFSNNSLEFYLTILALWKLGKEIVFLNTRLSSDELAYQLKSSQTTYLLSATEFLNVTKIDHLKSIKTIVIPKFENIKHETRKQTTDQTQQSAVLSNKELITNHSSLSKKQVVLITTTNSRLFIRKKLKNNWQSWLRKSKFSMTDISNSTHKKLVFKRRYIKNKIKQKQSIYFQYQVILPQKIDLAEGIASIMYTSGTTGRPKGVGQLFLNHQASAIATKASLKMNLDDCFGCAVPLFHISGLSILCRSLLIGCSVRLYNNFNRQKITRDLVNGVVTIISVVPYMLEQLLEILPENGYHNKFRLMLLGGASAKEQTLLLAKKQHVSVVQSYGMTETCSQIVALNPELGTSKINASGKPLSRTKLKILDEATFYSKQTKKAVA